MDAGEFNTVTDLAKAVGLAERHVSRQLRLAYLSPEALDHLVTRHAPPALSLADLVAVAERPWAEQMRVVFERPV